MTSLTTGSPTRETGNFVEFETKAVSEDGIFTGWASVFGAKDDARDIVQAGAFAKSLAVRPADKVKMLRSHDTSEPIGVWLDIREDDRGLFVKGQLILTTVKGRETYELVKAGALDGMSIGYRTVRDRMDRVKGARILEQLDLYEISIVTFPMLATATITNVKSNGNFRNLIQAINRATSALS